MCARSILSASLGSFIFFNESELGSHFSSLSVLLCLIQREIIGGGGLKPPPSLPASDGLVDKQFESKVKNFQRINFSTLRMYGFSIEKLYVV